MGMPYFIFNNVNSLDMGIVVNKLPPVFLAEKNIELIEVIGRSGYLTHDYNTYKSISKTIECTIMDNSKIEQVKYWLNQRHGEVTFSNDPNKFYKCVIKNQVPFDEILYRVSTFQIQFECQPFGYLLNEKPISTEDLKKNPNLVENSGAQIDTKYWVRHSDKESTGLDVWIDKGGHGHPRDGIGIASNTIKGWYILANTSLEDKFTFDTSKDYTISCVIYANIKSTITLQISDKDGLNSVFKQPCVLEQGFNKVSFTFKPITQGIQNNIRFKLETNQLGLVVFDLKLEEGTKATSWQLSSLDKRLYVENKGTIESNPSVTVYGTGDITLYVNKETIRLKNVADKITINNELMECYKDTEIQNYKMQGNFISLIVGSNNITWSGNVNRIEVEKNTRFI